MKKLSWKKKVKIFMKNSKNFKGRTGQEEYIRNFHEFMEKEKFKNISQELNRYFDE